MIIRCKMKESNDRIEALSIEYAKLYTLPPGCDFLNITSSVLNHPLVKDKQKEHLRTTHRQVVIFNYPSDDLKIKGLISFIPHAKDSPTLVFLRGGNRTFGILNPGSDLVCFNDYTVITTTYRGGVSEGEDEYGGDDVNDVKNLIEYIPTLQNKLTVPASPHMFLLGASRGGMQMFLALERFPELQTKFSKIVALSGLFDLHCSMTMRPDMKEMFTDDFRYIEGVNEEEWIRRRDPQKDINKIDSNLPILILDGSADERIAPEEGLQMAKALKEYGKQVTYQIVQGGDHCLRNQSDRVQIITKWLEMSKEY